MKRNRKQPSQKPVAAFAVAALALVLDVSPVFSQGTVTFANTPPFFTIADRRVYSPVTCAPLVGTNWVAALYFGFDANSINHLAVRSLEDHSLLSAIARFRDVDPSSPKAGTWFGGNRILLEAIVGQALIMQVRVWDMNVFTTFDDARAMGGYALESAPFSYLVTDTTEVDALWMDNFRGIVPPECVPEPSVFALAVLGAGMFSLWQRSCRRPYLKTLGSRINR